MRELLTMQNVTARYQSPDGELTAAENISLTVSQGEFVSILGPRGCGKSTLLTIMAGLKRPSEGKVLLDGEPITGPGGKIGYMLQKDNLGFPGPISFPAFRRNAAKGGTDPYPGSQAGNFPSG